MKTEKSWYAGDPRFRDVFAGRARYETTTTTTAGVAAVQSSAAAVRVAAVVAVLTQRFIGRTPMRSKQTTTRKRIWKTVYDVRKKPKNPLSDGTRFDKKK